MPHSLAGSYTVPHSLPAATLCRIALLAAMLCRWVSAGASHAPQISVKERGSLRGRPIPLGEGGGAAFTYSNGAFPTILFKCF